MTDPADDRTLCQRCKTPIDYVVDRYRSYWVHRWWVEECPDGPKPPPIEVDLPDLQWPTAEQLLSMTNEARCNGCGRWVDADLLDAEGFGPDCQTQDAGSQCS